ncbi:MAG: PPC domain-containing protein, partial [Chthoniobacteraceae bacterium]
MKAKLIHAGVLLSIWLLVFVPFVRAASPAVSSIEPQGGQRGSEMEVSFTGDRLQDAKGILFYGKGVEVTSFQVVDDQHARAKLKIAPDCPLGENQLRVWTASGISELHMFYIGPFPNVTEVEPNDDPAHAQPVPLNVTVSGTITNEDVDCFSVDVKKGQRITAEVEGIRLGIMLFDPWLGILKKDGTMLASCDDSSLLLQDPIVSIIAPEDGTYVIQLRDSTYGGSDKCKYRLHIGTFPQPTVVYPPGGPAGQELTLHFLGDVSGPIEKKITMPALENGLSKTESLFAEQDGLNAPAGNPFRVSPFPNVLEVKPNNDIAHATKTDLPLPLAFNGIIAEKGAAGFFRFKAKKNETFDFRVYARILRSPIDSVLAIYDGNGNQLASNDDAGGPDSYLRFKIPADGEYCISVTDQIKRGGSEFTYRVEVT